MRIEAFMVVIFCKDNEPAFIIQIKTNKFLNSLNYLLNAHGVWKNAIKDVVQLSGKHQMVL